ncbi:PocR ligand-binding domain-containing protein [Helicovermis profundi]|uniref:PocR ligand-binding domain-containing protein n=1 Tax=Helicovermis profundi TaxID=3065157 RepID=A0AAU9EBY2_9FIRM|nr:PocR ligand-binding domain-containing protein [Clostridia bacterium S502]
MNSNLLKLDYIINIEKFQKIQDDIAKAVDMAILTVDYKGKPFTRHSSCSEFCRRIREHENYSKLCEKCDSRGGLEAVRKQKPYIYLCHVGLVDLAIPIIVDGQYLGAIMAGQVRLESSNAKLEKIVNDQYYNINLDEETELEKLYENLPIMKFEKINEVANMLFHITNYMVEDAVLKIALSEYDEEKINSKVNNKLVKTLQNVDKDDKSIHLTTVKTKFPKYLIIINPALEYISDNYNEKLYIDDMAKLCNISTSYFSKLFKKSIGQSFSTYVNIVKMNKAKEVLKAKDIPIINLALELGYEDCGYFIKVFKKIVGTTPAAYKKEISKKN